MSFRFDPRRRIVELFPGVPQSDTEAGALCRRHGDAMVLPRGWVLDDQRDLTPRLFTVTRPPAPTDPRPNRPRRRTQREAASDSTLFVIDGTGGLDDTDDQSTGSPHVPTEASLTVAEVAGAHPDSRPDETRAMPWVPVFDTGDNLGGVLDATTPLLRKAFGTDHRERHR